MFVASLQEQKHSKLQKININDDVIDGRVKQQKLIAQKAKTSCPTRWSTK